MYDLPDVALQGMPQLEQTGAHSEMPRGTRDMIACRVSLRKHTNVPLNWIDNYFQHNLRTRGKNPAVVKKFISRSPYSQSIEATLYPKECLNQTLNFRSLNLYNIQHVLVEWSLDQRASSERHVPYRKILPGNWIPGLAERRNSNEASRP